MQTSTIDGHRLLDFYNLEEGWNQMFLDLEHPSSSLLVSDAISFGIIPYTQTLAALKHFRFNRKICAKEMTQSELFSCIERHRTDLLRVRTRFAARDQYPESTPGQPFWPPQYALLHMSWHQCHCDLYRPFINDYPELGPHAVLNGMSEPDRKLMRDKCFDHAEHIVQIVSEFLHRKKEQHLLEHDAAVCAYHAARLILLRAEDAPRNPNSPAQVAINKAQLCLNVITQYFSFSAQLKNMVCSSAILRLDFH